jgi:hypothetical protein
MQTGQHFSSFKACAKKVDLFVKMHTTSSVLVKRGKPSCDEATYLP